MNVEPQCFRAFIWRSCALPNRESRGGGFAEALQAVVDVTEPAQVRGIEENTAHLLALIDLVELLLRKGNLRHLNVADQPTPRPRKRARLVIDAITTMGSDA